MEVDIVNLLAEILKFAIKNSVPLSEMPSAVLILTDVDFYSATHRGGYLITEAETMIHQDYKGAGYKVPRFIFWNLNNPNLVIAQKGKNGVAEISGFNPSILKAVLALGNEA
jgi:hypothetical protein